MLVQNHVKLMRGKGERLDHEFMNLNDTLPHYRYLRLTVESFKGAVWKNFTTLPLLEEHLVDGSLLNGRVLLISTQWVP